MFVVVVLDVHREQLFRVLPKPLLLLFVKQELLHKLILLHDLAFSQLIPSEDQLDQLHHHVHHFFIVNQHIL